MRVIAPAEAEKRHCRKRVQHRKFFLCTTRPA